MRITRSIYKQKKKVDISIQRRIGIYFARFWLTAKLGCIIILISLFFIRENNFFTPIRAKISELVGDFGFVLDNVLIAGQANLSTDEIVASLNADVGTPIFSIKLDDSKQILEKNSWVKSVILRRQIPDTIFVSLIEKKPIALWQVNKKLYVIDEEGDIIENASIEKFMHFIHFVGEDANVHANELIRELNKNPSFAAKVKHAVRYGQRRWDLNIEENINVKMPQHNFQEAYSYLIKMYEAGNLFGKDIKSIDLRDSSKIYVEKNQPVKENSKKDNISKK